MDFNEFLRMDPDEAREFVMNKLAETAEVWMGDSLDDKLVRSVIGATRSLYEGAIAIHEAGDDAKPNPYVAGLWSHAYRQIMANFVTLDAMTDMKRKMQGS